MAINLALLLGASRVFLLGFDMKTDGGKTNWHDANISKTITDASYHRFEKGFVEIVKDLPVVFPGRQIFNCGTDSRLRAFPKMSLEEALCVSSCAC
jgi:hypothetical protein